MPVHLAQPPATPRSPIRPRSVGRRAFTLIELMISLALVLLLTLAVTQIFRVTTGTISKGLATGEVVRGLDAVRTALQVDFTGTDAIGYDGFNDVSGIMPLSQQPAIVIHSSSTQTYSNAADRTSDRDGTIGTIDSDNDGVDDLTLNPYRLGQRYFRTDTFSFFSRGGFDSQTNVDGGSSFSGDVSSTEAWVWYGHGRVYSGTGNLNTSANYYRPGEPLVTQNINHYYANDFVLLRSPLLLKDRVDHDSDPLTQSTVVDDRGNPIYFGLAKWDLANPADIASLYYQWPAAPNPNSRWWPNLGPIHNQLSSEPAVPHLTAVVRFSNRPNDAEVNTFGVPAPPALLNVPTNLDHRYVPDQNTTPAPGFIYHVQDSRVDVVGLTAAAYRQRLGAVQLLDQTGSPNGVANSRLLFATNVNRPNQPTWYDRLFARSVNRTSAYRFWLNPFVLKPLDPGEVSQATNYLLGGASHFIVEYAGDFLAQTPTGAIDTAAANTGLSPDGVLDYTVDPFGVRHVRWYGMPRDVNQDNVIPGPASRATPVNIPGLGASNVLLVSTDVRPLADYLPLTGVAPGLISATNGFPFEKRLPGSYPVTSNIEQVSSRDAIANYSDTVLTNGQNYDPGYLVAWGPGDFDGTIYPNTTHPYTFTSAASPTGALRPSLIRVVAQSIDRREKLENPIPMELVFRVPVE